MVLPFTLLSFILRFVFRRSLLFTLDGTSRFANVLRGEQSGSFVSLARPYYVSKSVMQSLYISKKETLSTQFYFMKSFCMNVDVMCSSDLGIMPNLSLLALMV
jgi:hypothetical protein